MNGKEAIEYIHSVCWLGSRPGLERITKLCTALGNPERSLRVIHVAGTNGKGSFCSMLSEILVKSGYKTGLFTSPYIVSFNERIRINGQAISDLDLASVTETVKACADRMEEAPTEFELITAVAFEYFRRCECDFVVLEAGLGGRLDSTNVVPTPVLSVITGIALDHMSILGDTVEKIAVEKAGIIKDGVPVVLGEGENSALSVISRAAYKTNSKLYTVDYGRLHDETFSLDGTDFSFDGFASRMNSDCNTPCEKYRLSLLGEYQTRNAAVVLTAVEALRELGVEIHDTAVRDGLRSARWSARFELLSKNPTVIYDGAHNVQGVDAAVRNIKLLFGDVKPIVLMGVMEDKEHSAMTDIISKVAGKIHTVTPGNHRAMDSVRLAEEFAQTGVSAAAYGSIGAGVTAAMADAEAEELPLVVLGSLYMYADVAAKVGKT